MNEQIATIDFHVTSECSQECPYCWGPQNYEKIVDTGTAMMIIDRVEELDIKRIVFTGGDPLKRKDTGTLIRHAKEAGLEVAVSTTGDELTPEFLKSFGRFIDLISLPLDGSSEKINALTKKAGHFKSIMNDLEWLRFYPEIDVKIATPVTRYNLKDVPNILKLVEKYAVTTEAHVFYNIFQAFPRSMKQTNWDELLISEEEFNSLRKQLDKNTKRVRCNFLSQETLDRLYVMIFPDGKVVIPNGPDFNTYGKFLEIKDLNTVIEFSQFDVKKHIRHSLGWGKKKMVNG